MSQPTPSDDAQALIDRLKGDKDLRVWSVVVTIMGDMARAPGESISGAILSELMGAMGIRPEATRVALHRLRKDGWIVSQRIGRGSIHALTDYGREQTLAVADRIYGSDLPTPAHWYLVVTNSSANENPEQSLIQSGFTAISSSVFLGNSPVEPSHALFSFSITAPCLPDWIKRRILTPELIRDTDMLIGILKSVTCDFAKVTILNQTAVRILVLHHWRRIVLRLPNLPVDVLDPVPELQLLVHRLLDQCSATTEVNRA